MDKSNPPKWATHTMHHQQDGEFCFLANGIMASELYGFEEWEDEDYSPEYFRNFGWVVTKIKPKQLENK